MMRHDCMILDALRRDSLSYHPLAHPDNLQAFTDCNLAW